MDRRLFAGLFLLAAAILLAACAETAPAPSPVATTPPAQAEVLPSGAETAPSRPPVPATHPALAGTVDASPETCAAMETLMAETLGMEATWSSGPFVDPRAGQTGTACVITVTGTGVNFPTGPDGSAVITAMEALGWTNLDDYSAGGAQTNMAGFGEGDELCVYTEHWEPAPEVTCPEDQPISACEMEPEQRLWTITMECADRAPTPPAQVSITPAGAETCAESVRLMAETLGIEGTTGEAPFAGFLIRGSAGTGCQVTVAGTGADLEATYWEPVPAAMEKAGWIVVWTYAAGGPSSGFIPFARGDEQCVYTEHRAPAPDVECPEGQDPFFECQVEPEQTLLTFTMNCATVATTPPVQVSITPAGAETCAAMATVMNESLGKESTTGMAPFPDYYTGQTGTGCQVAVTGTGVDFPEGFYWDVVDAAMQEMGWIGSGDHPNSFPTSNWSGYTRGDELCVYNEAWEPGPAATCPGDQPVWECQMAPEQKLWTFTMSCAIVEPPPPAYLSIPPAASPEAQVSGTPASAETCAEMETVVEDVLDKEGTTGEAPFVDTYSGETIGAGCVITVTGTGVDFPEGPDYGALRDTLEETGWTEEMDYGHGAPDVWTTFTYSKGDEMCLYRHGWEPAPEVDCPAGQLVTECEMEPEQKLWTITLNCVTVSE